MDGWNFTEQISPFQVTGENGRSGAALIGVCSDTHRATIYHTRALTVEDIIHELLPWRTRRGAKRTWYTRPIARGGVVW